MEIKRTFTIENKEWYQLFGEEATKWFGKNCYWVPWKFSRESIDRAWYECQKSNDRVFTHFLNKIKGCG